MTSCTRLRNSLSLFSVLAFVSPSPDVLAQLLPPVSQRACLNLAMEYMCVQLDLPYDSHALYRLIQIQQTLNLMPAGLISPHQDLRIISPDVFKLFDDARAAMLAANDACVDDGGQDSIGVSPADVPANVPLCYHGVSMRSVAFQPYSRPRIFRRFPDLGRDHS